MYEMSIPEVHSGILDSCLLICASPRPEIVIFVCLTLTVMMTHKNETSNVILKATGLRMAFSNG